jgi:hypothetical protein
MPMLFARRPQGLASRIVRERRHKRSAATLLGRFPFSPIDLAAGGAAVSRGIAAPPGLGVQFLGPRSAATRSTDISRAARGQRRRWNITGATRLRLRSQRPRNSRRMRDKIVENCRGGAQQTTAAEE